MPLKDRARQLVSALGAAPPSAAFADVVVSKKGGLGGPATVCKTVVLSRLARAPGAAGIPDRWAARKGEMYEMVVDGAAVRFTFLVMASAGRDFWTNLSRTGLAAQVQADTFYLALWNRPNPGDLRPAERLEVFALLPERIIAALAARGDQVAADRLAAFDKQFAKVGPSLPALDAHLTATLGDPATWPDRGRADGTAFLSALEGAVAEWVERTPDVAARTLAQKKVLELVRKLEFHARPEGGGGYAARYGRAVELYAEPAADRTHVTLELSPFESAALRGSFDRLGVVVPDAREPDDDDPEDEELAGGDDDDGGGGFAGDVDPGGDNDDDPEPSALASLRDRVAATEQLLAGQAVGVPIGPILLSAWAALDAGKHVVLTGAPGTAKTTIANAIATVAARAGLCTKPLFTTATTDWTALDTVGGYVPNPNGPGLLFQPGKFLQCMRSGDLRDNRWLVIDELNRADVDKAFGQFFTILSGHSGELPYRDGDRSVLVLCGRDEADAATYPADRFLVFRAPAEWRMLGTLNTTDKASLYEMSFAFMRRFAFVHVPLPTAAGLDEIGREVLRGRLGLDDPLAAAVTDLWGRLSVQLPLGPAIVIDIARYLAKRVATAADHEAAVSEAIAMYVVPHLEGCEPSRLVEVRTACQPYWTAAVADACLAFVPAAREVLSA